MFEAVIPMSLMIAYMLPTFIAGARGHQNGIAIFFINLFLGWTVLGWIAALVWAATGIEHQPRGHNPLDRFLDGNDTPYNRRKILKRKLILATLALLMTSGAAWA